MRGSGWGGVGWGWGWREGRVVKALASVPPAAFRQHTIGSRGIVILRRARPPITERTECHRRASSIANFRGEGD